MLRLRLPPLASLTTGATTHIAAGQLVVTAARTGVGAGGHAIHTAAGTLTVTAARAGAGTRVHNATGTLVVIASRPGYVSGGTQTATGNLAVSATRTGATGKTQNAAGTLTVTATRTGGIQGAQTLTATGDRTVTVNRTGAAVTLRGATGNRITTANRTGVASVTGVPSGTTLQGVSNSTWNHQFAQWDAVRVYRLTAMNAAVTDFNCKVIHLSDDANVPIAGGQASANQVHDTLETFFASHPNVKVHYANGNEVDRDSPNMTQYVNTVAAMRDAIDDFPGKAEMWIDLTQNNIRNADSANRFAAVAPYLHGVGASWYPPGRLHKPQAETSATNLFIDPCFDVAEQWGIGKVACWEIGTPLSPNYNRPNYVETWIDATVVKRDTTGIAVSGMDWWDMQSDAGTANPGPDNRFQTDGALTATRWRNTIAAM